eukprot:TRINITY_DN3750_c0_g1_i1.p1 TRINITY_DN3750_c0_g1~~TRINITY_DN3750_c0_g1_i1.p1  ORF type:complete len:72 (+),score=0.47 TRINITY_DN3750_c0_g1_i1:31-246(+)
MASLLPFMRSVTPSPSLVRVILTKSAQHAKPNIRLSVESLGLKKVNHSIVHKNNSVIRGLIATVSYFVCLV